MSGTAPPRWLTADEQRAWLGYVRTVLQLPAALDAHLQRVAGMTHFEYFVLAMLSAQPDHALQLKDLAAVTSSSPSRLSHVMSRPEGRGWVVRCATGRGRAALARLRGYAKLAETAPLHVAEVRRLVFDALTPSQVSALEDITSRINAALGMPGD